MTSANHLSVYACDPLVIGSINHNDRGIGLAQVRGEFCDLCLSSFCEAFTRYQHINCGAFELRNGFQPAIISDLVSLSSFHPGHRSRLSGHYRASSRRHLGPSRRQLGAKNAGHPSEIEQISYPSCGGQRESQLLCQLLVDQCTRKEKQAKSPPCLQPLIQDKQIYSKTNNSWASAETDSS